MKKTAMNIRLNVRSMTIDMKKTPVSLSDLGVDLSSRLRIDKAKRR